MKKIVPLCFLLLCSFSAAALAQIPVKTLVEIVRAEDERRFDKRLEDLMKNADPQIRTRAALAAGRIGDEAAIAALVGLLEKDSSADVRTMAAFALGEIESAKAADAILSILNDTKNAPEIRARAVESAGKIAAANAKDEKSKALGEAILQTVAFEDEKRSGPYENVIELGLTAILRARPADAEKIVARFISAYTPKIRANALNTLARLRAKNANDAVRGLLQNDADAVVRANAARVLGAAEDNAAFELLLKAAVEDKDERVRVSAIRSLGSLKDGRAADELLERGEKLLADHEKSKFAAPAEKSELLEIAAVLGNLLKNSGNEKAEKLLDDLNAADNFQSPEIALALIRIKDRNDNLFDKKFIESFGKMPAKSRVQAISAFFQSFGEIPKIIAPDSNDADDLERLDNYKNTLLSVRETIGAGKSEFTMAIPDFLRAYAAFKAPDLPQVLLENLKNEDVFVRAAVAELLGEQAATKENVEALKNAFAAALKNDKNYDDAQLAILSALVKLDKLQAADSLTLALDAPNYLVRKRAAELIRQNDLQKNFPDFEQKLGIVKIHNSKNATRLGQILNTNADYSRAVSRKNGSVKAVLTTEKGAFTIDLAPEDAPLTVDNFIKLAKTGYFNGLSVHRVVPNFVMQDGDPLGNGSGGPGWAIRCEINLLEYERGALGMALSGKDTGGSQWFVTHSPQPHLDGGYTVFGKVNESDMKIVDSIVRGDRILSVKIVEGKSPAKRK